MIEQWTLSIFLGNFDLLEIFAPTYFYVIAGIVLILVLLIASVFDSRTEKKNALLLQEKMPEIASKFGKAVSVSADALRFVRDETIFDAVVKSVEIILPESNITPIEFEVRFNLPNLKEKFFIQHKSVFSEYSADCEPILLSAMPDDFIFHSLNSQFLLSLLEKRRVFNEIDKYPSDWGNQFRIAFENNVFIISWKFTPLKERYKAEKLEQICQTAVVFYDELSKK